MELVRGNWSIVRSSATADQLEIELYVYTGTQTTDRPGTATATILTSMIPALNQTNNYAIVNISPYIMDYIETELPTASLVSRGATLDEGVWFDYRTRLITAGTPASWSSYSGRCGIPGYARFTVGSIAYAAQDDKPVLITDDTTLYVPSTERLVVPAKNYDDGGTMPVTGQFYNGTGYTTIQATPGTATESVDVIEYVPEPIALTTTELYTYDGVSTYTKTHDVVRVVDIEQKARKIFFVNAWGAIQEMWFFGRTNESFRATGITARRDTKWYVSFENERHQYVDFYKNARETVTLNSGWQVEANNVLFQELLMSEKVWLSDGYTSGNPIPVRVTTSDLQMKSQRWDNVINYTIEFERAYDYAIT